MDAVYAALRLTHVVFGAFWFGAMVMLLAFVGPAMRTAGRRLTRETLRLAINVSAVLTVLSGVALFWRDFGSLPIPVWVEAPGVLAFGVGGIAGIIAMVVRLGISWPTDRRLGTAMRARDAAQADSREMTTLFAVQRWAGRATVALLALALALMAIARAL